jgi:hypothetical protein
MAAIGVVVVVVVVVMVAVEVVQLWGPCCRWCKLEQKPVCWWWQWYKLQQNSMLCVLRFFFLSSWRHYICIEVL